MNYFKPKNELKLKITHLFENYNIEYHSIFLGLSYIQYCKNIIPSNLQNYTLCAIILANKYLNDYNYNIQDITKSLNINIEEYVKIEIELLKALNWNLSRLDDNNIKLIKSW